jgi:guanylate kinase
MGKTSSGKTRLAEDLSEILKLEQKITYTTRPKRENEIDGIHYHFVKKEHFFENKFLCVEHYEVKPNGLQTYGVKKEDLDKALENDEDIIVVLTPPGYKELKSIYGDRIVGIYVMAPLLTRFQRYVQRESINPNAVEEAWRRLESPSDTEYFDGLVFESEHVVLNDNDYQKALDYAMTVIIEEVSNDKV